MFSDYEKTLFVGLAVIRDLQSRKRATALHLLLSGGRPLRLNQADAETRFSSWQLIPPIIDRVDVFILYRWSEFDKRFTAQLYDRLSLLNVEMDNHRPLATFYDEKRLAAGYNFR